MAGKYLFGVMVGCMTTLSTWAAPPVSTNAMGHAMVGSKHDLTGLDRRAGTGAMVGVAFDNYGNLCVYCHTQHTGQQKSDVPPLWNRADPVTVYTPYRSPTLDSDPRQPSGVSLACLSCHDGTLAVDRVAKRPMGFDFGASRSLHMKMSRTENMESCGQCHRGDKRRIPGLHDIGLAAFGQSLNDDHPVSIDYPPPWRDPKFHALPVDGVFSNGVRLFDGRVECASCHDVHNPQNAPFLRESARGAQLCLTCHEK